MNLELTSTAFQPENALPQEFTGDGRNISPPLAWHDLPKDTKSVALVCEDPDAPKGTFTHWVLFNVPADSRELNKGIPAEETLPNGARQGTNDFGKVGYGGPSPPPGKPHRYYFKLYALDQPLDLQPGATKQQVFAAMKGHVQGEAQLMGTYARQK